MHARGTLTLGLSWPCRLVGVVVVVLTLGLTATGARATVSASRPTAVPDCLGHPTVRPKEIVLACGDGNFGVRGLHWIGWGEPSAAATGTAYANDCTPSCAAGHFHTYRAVLVADAARQCKRRRVYGRVTLAFVGRSPYPAAKPSDLVYPLRCG